MITNKLKLNNLSNNQNIVLKENYRQTCSWHPSATGC